MPQANVLYPQTPLSPPLAQMTPHLPALGSLPHVQNVGQGLAAWENCLNKTYSLLQPLCPSSS